MIPQTSTSPLLPQNVPGAELSLREDGARYALLQRLTPVLQHQIMGNFQSMDMIAVMLDRRLQSATPDLDSMRQDCALLGSVSESALKSIINLLTWVRPKPAATQPFDAGVEECAALLFNDFKLKGVVISNEVSHVAAEVPCQALRSVVSAALFCLSDQAPVPAKLTLNAHVLDDCIHLSIEPSLHGSQHTGTLRANNCRLVNWRDLELLAAAESVELTRTDSGVRLAFKLPSGNKRLPASQSTA